VLERFRSPRPAAHHALSDRLQSAGKQQFTHADVQSAPERFQPIRDGLMFHAPAPLAAGGERRSSHPSPTHRWSSKMIRHTRKLALLALAAVAAACSDVPTADTTAAAAATTDPSFDYLSSDTALAVSIYGPGKVLKETTSTFRAEVTGGSGSYHYTWIAEVCYLDNTCRNPIIIGQGVGVSSVQHQIRAEHAEVNIAVQVHENQQVHKSGVADHHLLGPSTWEQGRISGNWRCTAPNSFPHAEYRIVDYSSTLGILFMNNYARDCNGQKVYKPDA
jgi:hypothetical protein